MANFLTCLYHFISPPTPLVGALCYLVKPGGQGTGWSEGSGQIQSCRTLLQPDVKHQPKWKSLKIIPPKIGKSRQVRCKNLIIAQKKWGVDSLFADHLFMLYLAVCMTQGSTKNVSCARYRSSRECQGEVEQCPSLPQRPFARETRRTSKRWCHFWRADELKQKIEGKFNSCWDVCPPVN